MSYPYYQHRVSWGGGRLTPGVKYLLITCGGMFLLQSFAPQQILFSFGLIPILVWKKLYLWQLGTYIFLHGSLFHLLFNLFALWMFGCQLERQWGTKNFLKYFFVTGIGAGISYALVNPGQLGPVIGASGAIYGILLAYAMIFPDQMIYVWFLFPMKAKYFVMIFGAIELYASIVGTGGGIAHVAHLGGMLFGYLYINYARIIKRIYLAYLQYKLRRLRKHMHVVDPKEGRDKKDFIH
ncbi:MAG: rhomboid family intramembrane serine protease [Proteobacteria bacterium]|nr:rhomboid family intramembrane serine protease [Pseudomonadota bacterium]NIS67619.1 rhomboid family intramembrane serine protease [Pseudomonadota bacterium]